MTKAKHQVQIDPQTGERYIIKSNGQRQRMPTDPKVWRPRFLAALADSGNVLYACSEAGIERQVAYRAKVEDEAFAQQWKLAIEDACDLLEAVARDRAIKSSDRLLMFLLAAHRPEVYGKAAQAASGASSDAPAVHIYLPDNGRTSNQPQLPAAEVLDVTPRQPVEPVEPLAIPADTNSETMAWLQEQPWFRRNKS